MTSARFDLALINKLTRFVSLSATELDGLAQLQSKPRNMKRGQMLVSEGQPKSKVFVLHEGWGCSYKDQPDGGRQIITFPIAGDCVGMRSAMLRTADHSVTLLTNAVVTELQGSRLMQTLNELPRLGAALMWAASREEAMVVEHLVNIGRRSALARTAHFFMELAERLNLCGRATETEFPCPLSQFVIADALGLTAIHVNRVLRQLRERELMSLKAGRVTIYDLAGLREHAGFHGGYLNDRG